MMCWRLGPGCCKCCSWLVAEELAALAMLRCCCQVRMQEGRFWCSVRCSLRNTFDRTGGHAPSGGCPRTLIRGFRNYCKMNHSKHKGGMPLRGVATVAASPRLSSTPLQTKSTQALHLPIIRVCVDILYRYVSTISTPNSLCYKSIRVSGFWLSVAFSRIQWCAGRVLAARNSTSVGGGAKGCISKSSIGT